MGAVPAVSLGAVHTRGVFISRTRVLSASAAVAVAAVAVAAVGTSDAGPFATQPVIPAVAPVSVPAIVLPLDSYRPTSDQALLIQRAEAVARQDCLQSLGLHLPIPTQAFPVNAPGAHSRLFGVLDPVEGAKVGYHGYGDPAALDRARETEVAAMQDPAIQAALTGRDPGTGQEAAAPVPSGGCLAVANRRLSLNGGGWKPQLVESLELAAGDAAARDPRVRNAVAAWIACMGEAGYSYPDPLAAGDDPRWATSQPTDAERAVAATDALCKDRTRLIPAWTAVTAEHQRTLIAQNETRLAADREELAATVRNAKSIVASR